jgi:hypothetical protein
VASAKLDQSTSKSKAIAATQQLHVAIKIKSERSDAKGKKSRAHFGCM